MCENGVNGIEVDDSVFRFQHSPDEPDSYGVEIERFHQRHVLGPLGAVWTVATEILGTECEDGCLQFFGHGLHPVEKIVQVFCWI